MSAALSKHFVKYIAHVCLGRQTLVKKYELRALDICMGGMSADYDGGSMIDANISRTIITLSIHCK